MFTMAQLDELHGRLGNSDSLPDYLRALAALGVVRFESFVADGHTDFVGADGRRVSSPPHHELLDIAHSSDRDAFLQHLRKHERGETTYVQMSAGLAASGVSTWVADTAAMTMTYYDRACTALLVEDLETAAQARERRGR